MNNNKHEVIQRLRECIQFEVYSGEESLVYQFSPKFLLKKYKWIQEI